MSSVVEQVKYTGKQNFQIAQISDLHLYSDKKTRFFDICTWDSLRATIETIQMKSPDLILVTGDISQDNSSCSYENFIDAFEGISTPVHILAGNHDGQLMYEVCSHFPSCSSAKVISLGHWRILMLDSTVSQQIYGMINLQQQQWIEQEISTSPNSSFLICCHHHPEPVGSAWIDQHMMKNGAQFLSFLSQFKQVKMVSFGHIHQCHENMFEHIQIISTPATSVQFTPGVDVFTLDDKQPGFRWFELNDSGRYHTQIERLAPNTFVANPQATGY